MPAESTLRDRNGPGYQLIETLRWQRGAGFLRGERHLARLRASAEALGFAWIDGVVDATLADAIANAENDMRVRLTLDANGTAQCTVAPFQPVAADKVWNVKIAQTRLGSDDPLLRHKTSRRAIYDAARSEFSASEADEVLLLNERDEMCEGTITSLFLDMDDGSPLLTPSLDCGLLAGVLRGWLIETGKAREAVLSPAELARAKGVFIGNSLRGLIPARLT
ncbi:MAG: aminotransferase class IV family protein [Mesorhizobium sp.]